MRRLIVAALFICLPAASHALPIPPCNGPPTPPFGEVNGAPQWQIWSGDELRAKGWQPAECLSWSGDTKLVVAISSRFRSQDDVFQRLANIGAWPSIRYWSVSRQSWQSLALSVSAMDPNPVVGRIYQFSERDDNTGESVYRLQVLRRDPAHLTVATENVSPIRVSIVTAFEPRSLQTVTFVQRIGADQWNTYQITRVGAGANLLVLGHSGSFLNRLEAVRRYLAGQSPDQQPPLAPR
jgi:hypothetical protein